jgi:predicted RNase H-like nuclease
MTKLDKPLRREIDINGEAHVVVITPQGLKLTAKGKRLGHEVTWQSLLHASAAAVAAVPADDTTHD